jgi:hypothetical protein
MISLMKRVLALLLILVFLLGYLPNVQHAKAEDAKWTIMVYMAADNDLEDMSLLDFEEMAQVGSTEDVKIVVQYDRKVGGATTNPDWSTTKRFLINESDEPLPVNQIEDIGETGMNDPNTLIDFANWAMSNFPADHYFLILWDHGLGWRGLVKDESNPSSYLTTPELGTALSQIVASNGGRKLDIVGFDTCRTTLELMYEIREYVDFIVGSEKDEDARGWAYDDFLQSLVVNPSMPPIDLSKVVVDTFIEEYEGVSAYSAILYSVNASRIDLLTQSLDNLLWDLYHFIPYHGEEIRTARDATEKYEIDERDLYDLADELTNYVENVRIQRKAESVKSHVLFAVAYERHWDNEQDQNGIRLIDAHGIALSYPTTQIFTSYSDLAFSVDTLWDEYLDYYSTPGKTISVLDVEGTNHDSNGDLLNDTMMVTLISGINGTVEYEIHRSNELVKEGSLNVSALVPGTITYSSIVPGFYDYHFFLLNETGYLRNYKTVMSSEMSRDPILYVQALHVESMITVRGKVKDEDGNDVVGASISMKNNETSEILQVAMNESGYSFEIIFPRWMQPGDTIELKATYEGRIGGLSFRVPSNPLDLSYDVVIDLSDTHTGQLDLSVLALIMILLILAIPVSIALTSYVLKRPKSEEEVEEEEAPPADVCGICGAGINLGVFSRECTGCGAMFHSACIKGKKKCPYCRKPLK